MADALTAHLHADGPHPGMAAHGDELHPISTDDHPFLRWRFTELSPDRFVRLGESSTDEARTWLLEERMVATRRADR